MASRSDRKTTPRPRATKAKGEHPIDTISMNVQKAHGIVATLQMGLNEDMDLARDLRNAFWALSDLLWDACKALDEIVTESLANREGEGAT